MIDQRSPRPRVSVFHNALKSLYPYRCQDWARVPRSPYVRSPSRQYSKDNKLWSENKIKKNSRFPFSSLQFFTEHASEGCILLLRKWVVVVPTEKSYLVV